MVVTCRSTHTQTDGVEGLPPLKKLRAIVRPSCRPAKAPALAPQEPDPVACRPLPGPPPPNVQGVWHPAMARTPVVAIPMAAVAPGMVLAQGPQVVPGPLKPGTPQWWAQRPHRPILLAAARPEPKFQGAPVYVEEAVPEPATTPEQGTRRPPKTPPEPAPGTPEEPVPSNFKRPTAHYGMSGMVPIERPYVFCLHLILGSVRSRVSCRSCVGIMSTS